MTDQGDPAESAETEPTSEVADRVAPSIIRRRRSRGPALVVAALLVGAGLFLALRGMQQVVAHVPAAPAPTATASTAPPSIEAIPTPTPPPTPMPTSSALILEP